jgi:ATP-dependent exoDNAse (exonuclease V) alpha subunit
LPCCCRHYAIRLEEHGLSAQKDRDWNKKEVLLELREQWAHYSNAHLKLHGHDVQIDHRSHKERGIEVEPQPKLGRNILEQEKRVQQLEGMKIRKRLYSCHRKDAGLSSSSDSVTFTALCGNLMLLFDIVTKHHATFMWGDVQKGLASVRG